MFVFDLPTTGAISFSDLLVSNRFVTELGAATDARARLRAVLKESKREDGERDWLRVIKAVDDYLPHLISIVNCVRTDDLILRYEPLFDWRPTLTAPHLFRSSIPRVLLPSLHYELFNVLLVSAFALSNLSSSIVSSLSAPSEDGGKFKGKSVASASYETSRYLSDAEKKARDERVKFAADLQCRACGVFEHLAEVVLPEWENEVGVEGKALMGGGVETKRDVVGALAKMALAHAQSLAIRKLLSSSLSLRADTFSPGPPLPKSHPSPSLLAKLHLNVTSLFESARASCEQVSKSAARPNSVGGPTNGRGGGRSRGHADKEGASTDSREEQRPLNSHSTTLSEVHPDLRSYLASQHLFHLALAHKWLGVDAGENGGRYGEAIAFLQLAKEELQEGEEKRLKFKALRIGGGEGKGKEKERKEKARERKGKRKEELESVEAFLSGYHNLNGTVAFQPILPSSHLASKVPAGRPVLSSKPFSRPTPIFGPGSPGYVVEDFGLSRMRLGEGVEPGEVVKEGEGGGGLLARGAGGEYAGAGAYF